MTTLVIDFETYWDNEYSLTKMSTEEYLKDSRFEVLGMGVKRIDGLVKAKSRSTYFDSVNDIRDYLAGIHDDTTYVIAHNARFDATILAWYFDFVPNTILCTLSLSQTVKMRVPGQSASLGAMSKLFNLGEKGNALVDTKGKRRKDLTPEENRKLGEYCLQDVNLTHKLYEVLWLRISSITRVIRVIDMTVRMFTQPSIELDTDIIEKGLKKEKERKYSALKALAPDGDVEKVKNILRSRDKFAQVLKELGVDPPLKKSLTTGKYTYAFAKTDAGMHKLLAAKDPRVKLISQIRSDLSTNIVETRLQRFLDISKRGVGKLSVPLKFHAARTGRYGGEEKINLQNLPRGSDLRYAMKAPSGHVIITMDLSQIEARLLAMVAGETDLLTQFAEGRDVYSEFASLLYNRKITKADARERFVGKVCILSLGYGCGKDTFFQRLSADIDITREESDAAHALYRRRFPNIVRLWKECDNALHVMISGRTTWLTTTGLDGQKRNRICVRGGEVPSVYLDGYLHMFYPELSKSQTTNEFSYVDSIKNCRKKIYGAMLTENIMQYLANIVIQEVALNCKERNMQPALQVHDELVYVVPDLPDKINECEDVLTTEVEHCTIFTDEEFPLVCEISTGESYGDTK